MLDASLILVNYRCEEETLRCLEHLEHLGDASRPRQRVVFDNSPERGLADAPDLKRLCEVYESSNTNLGFGNAVNQAARCATSDNLVLLNPDARPDESCLAGLIAVFASEPDIALAGPRLLPGHAETPLPSATRIDPNLLTSLVEYTALKRLVGRDWLTRHYFVDTRLGRQVCASLQGACLAVRRSVFEQLGGFDPRFFFYWEDTDLSRRARALGHHALYCPDLECQHVGGRSLIPEAERAHHFWSGLRAYHLKYGGVRRLLALRLLLPIGISMELFILMTLDRLRRGQDSILRRDLGVHRLRLKEQFRRSPVI